MERLNAEPETTATIKKQIDELKTQHSKDMESLYAYYAQVYRQDQEDLRRCCADSFSQDLDGPAESSTLDVSHCFVIKFVRIDHIWTINRSFSKAVGSR